MLQGCDAELSHRVSGARPDLVILSTSGVDSIIWGLLFSKLGLNIIYLFDVLGGQVSSTHPPVQSHFIPHNNLASRVTILWQWLKHKNIKDRYESYSVSIGTDILTQKEIKRLAKYCNYPIRDISFWTDMPNPLMNFQEVALFPSEFEFLSKKRKNRHYLESSIDLTREQPHFPWERLNLTRPVVYVALGTLPLLSKEDYIIFFNMVIMAATEWPDWSWVLSIGNNLHAEDLCIPGSNMILVKRAPQLELLKVASLMITHGGPNSIKECIYFGVPMILFPLWFDQPGNVARVVSHGLGVRGDLKSLSTSTLINLIKEVSNNKRFRKSVKKMQRHFVDLESSKPSVDFFEKLITGQS